MVGAGAEGTHTATAARTKVFVMSSPLGLDAEIRQTFRIVSEGSEFTAQATSYDYALHRHGGGEILAYHWHPATQASYPHLHISAEWGTARELAVIPQRSNWQRILIDESSPS